MKEISKGLEIPNENEDYRLQITEETVMDDEETETDEDEDPKQTSENKIRQRQPRNQISSDA